MLAVWIALGAVLAAVVIVSLAALLLWRSSDEAGRALARRVVRLPFGRKLRLATWLARDPRVPLLVRAIPPGLILYLALPIDIIPDFVPVLGHLDDLLVLLVGIGLLLRFVPRQALEEQLSRFEAAEAG